MLEAFDVEAFVFAAELQQVERGQIAGGIIQEHVFRTGVRGVDRAGIGAGVPVVDGGVILNARIGRLPGGIADLLPQILGFQGLGDRTVLAGSQVPVAICFDSAKEIIADPHRIVGILPGNGEIGL